MDINKETFTLHYARIRASVRGVNGPYAYLTLVSTPSSTSYLSANRSQAACPPLSDVIASPVTSPGGSSGVSAAINSSVKARCPPPRAKSSPVTRPSWSASSWPKSRTTWPADSPTSRSVHSRRKSADVRKPRPFTSIDRNISIGHGRRVSAGSRDRVSPILAPVSRESDEISNLEAQLH